MKKSILNPLLPLLVLALAPWVSQAQPSPNPPGQISYQGFLTDANGYPLATNTPRNYTVIFRIYDASTAGNEQWAEQQVVTVDRGYFTVMLGNGSAIDANFTNDLTSVFSGTTASDRYLGMTVTDLSNNEIAPRLRLLASPYAFLARNAVKLVSSSSGGDLITSSSTNVTVNGTITVNGAATVGTLNATGAATVGTLTATGAATVGALTAIGAATVSGTMTASNFVGFGTIPIGGIIMWSGSTPPPGWALCDGSNGNPDLRGRFVLGAGTGTGLTPRYVGNFGGAETHALALAEMPAHTHQQSVNTVGYEADYNSASEAMAAPNNSKNNGSQTFTTGTAGGGTPFNMMPPYYVLAYIIRVQ